MKDCDKWSQLIVFKIKNCQNGKWLKWKVVKMKSSQNASGQNEKY